jgi:hypothetical protein
LDGGSVQRFFYPSVSVFDAELNSEEAIVHYRDAFQTLWDDALSHSPSDETDIATSLQRTLVLRSFNKSALAMQEQTGSSLERNIGIGKRVDKSNGELVSVYDEYPSFYKKVISAFENLPIAKHFGINYKDAMALPVDEWNYIHKTAIEIAKNDKTSVERLIPEIHKLLEMSVKLTQAQMGVVPS